MRKNRTRIIPFLVLLSMTIFMQSAGADNTSQVKTDKDVYNAGEIIHVNFFNAPGSTRDWICIVAEGAPDTDAGDYKYMPGGVSQGELTFEASSPGKYEVRAYYNYSRKGYVVSSRYSFTVADKTSAGKRAHEEEKIKPVEKPEQKSFSSAVSKANIAVFHFIPLSVDVTNYGITVTNALINNLRIHSSFSILDRKDLEIFLSSNNLQQNDEMENIVEIGNRLGLNFVIAGNIEKRGMMIVTDCRVISIAQKNVIFANRFVSTGEGNLMNNIKKVNNLIIEAILHSN